MSILAASTITVMFYHGRGGWYNRLIRLWTRSRYSHCEAVLTSRHEGVRYLTADAEQGVHLHTRLVGTPDDWDRVTLPITEEERRDIQAFILSEIGSGYDWKGIFLSQVMGLRREHPTRWFCSELCAAVLKHSNCGLAFLRDRACTYSPGALREAIAPA